MEFHPRKGIYRQISALLIFYVGGTFNSTNLEFSRNDIRKSVKLIDTALHDRKNKISN